MQMETTYTSPGDDFYSFVNREWIESNPIPDDKSSWSPFHVLNELIKTRVKELLETTSNEKYLAAVNLYYQGMNLNDNPVTVTQEFISRIKNTTTKEELLDVVFEILYINDLSCSYNMYPSSDLENSDNVILHLDSGGLSLPDRDYYFNEDSLEIRQAFREFMSNYTSLFGVELDLDSVYNLEEQFASHTYTQTQRRDSKLRNNPTTYEELSSYNSFSITQLFNHFNIEPTNKKINVANPEFIRQHNELWNSESLEVWQDYYIWRLILDVGEHINEECYKMKFDFYETKISGIPMMQELWKRVLDNCNDKLGFLVGEMYTDIYFPESSKTIMVELVGYLKQELQKRLSENDWMTESTKEAGLRKLENMNFKIGYPDVQEDYSSLLLSTEDSYLTNNLKCNNFNVIKAYKDFYQKKDRSKWSMWPHMVNAYYSQTNNEIVFPAGILDYPLFSPDRLDISSNFGGIGVVIGHEITHGFDNNGRCFDEFGNLNDWWTSDDENNYKNKTTRLRDQYNEYIVEGKNVNGDLTLGENIADLGGCSISYHALQSYLNDHPDENILVNEQTPAQRFFINYARIWRSNMRKEEKLRRLVIDPHSPADLRVNGVVSNLHEFYEAFNVNETNKLYKEDIITIW